VPGFANATVRGRKRRMASSPQFIGIVRPRLDVFVEVSKPEKLTVFPAEHSLMLVRLPETDEFERM
jgi:hypothetical protein